MKKVLSIAIVICSLLAMAGIGSAAPCTGCDYTRATAWTSGTVVTLTGPDDSGTQDRDLDYRWTAFDCDTGATYTLDLVTEVGTGLTSQILKFYAPPPGNFRISLAVNDKRFTTTCKDEKVLCFSTSSTCPTIGCDLVCEDDVYTARVLPWDYQYTPAAPAVFVSSWTYTWTTHALASNTPIETLSETGTSTLFSPAWSNGLKYPPGDYIVSFKVMDGARTVLGPCDSCTVTVVEKPTATIGGYS